MSKFTQVTPDWCTLPKYVLVCLCLWVCTKLTSCLMVDFKNIMSIVYITLVVAHGIVVPPNVGGSQREWPKLYLPRGAIILATALQGLVRSHNQHLMKMYSEDVTIRQTAEYKNSQFCWFIWQKLYAYYLNNVPHFLICIIAGHRQF